MRLLYVGRVHQNFHSFLTVSIFTQLHELGTLQQGDANSAFTRSDLRNVVNRVVPYLQGAAINRSVRECPENCLLLR